MDRYCTLHFYLNSHVGCILDSLHERTDLLKTSLASSVIGEAAENCILANSTSTKFATVPNPCVRPDLSALTSFLEAAASSALQLCTASNSHREQKRGRLRLMATSNTKPSTASSARLRLGSLNYSDERNLHLLCDLLSGSACPLPAYCSRSGLSASQNFLILAGRLSSQDSGPSRGSETQIPALIPN
jgi:hypothetical protein